MALIGSSIDPRMFVQDYSGFADAARIQGAGMANFGNQIGGAIADYGEQQKEAKAGIAKGKAALEFAKTLKPELADQIDQLGSMFNDPSKSQVELSAIGSQMGDYVAAMIGEERYKDDMEFRRAADNRAERGLSADIESAGISNTGGKLRNKAVESELAANDALTKAIELTAPAKLEYLGMVASSDPATAGLAMSIEKYKDASPLVQAGVYSQIKEMLSPAQQEELKYYVSPVTMPDGSVGEAPIAFNPATGDATQIQLKGQLPPTGSPGEVTAGVLPPKPGIMLGAKKPESVSDAIALEKRAEDKAAAIQSAETAVAKSQQTIDLIDSLYNPETGKVHPGFDALFGMGPPSWAVIPGTAAADARTKFTQLDAKGFMVAIQDMKGMGALSNAEGARASAAFTGMDPSMSEDAAKKQLKVVRDILKKGIERQKSGVLVNPDGTETQAAPTADPAKSASSRLRGMKQ